MPTTADSRTKIIRNIGARIRAARLECGLTQAEVARPYMSRSCISQIENGLVMPSVLGLHIIGDRLNKPAYWFLQDTPEEELAAFMAATAASRGCELTCEGGHDPREDELLYQFRRLDLRNKRLVVALATQLARSAANGSTGPDEGD